MHSSLIDKYFDNTVDVDGGGQLKVGEVVEKSVVKTVEEDEDLNNDDDENDNDDDNKNNDNNE